MSLSEDSETGTRLRRVAIVLALLAVALGLRVWGIGKESFWNDEVCSVRLSDYGVKVVLTNNAQDVHPPLYYLGLHFWRRVLGDSDIRIRAYSVPWSLVCVFFVFLLGRDVGGWPIGVIALLLGAVNPLSIYYAQEARMYAQVTALCTGGSWCLWRWMTAVSVNGLHSSAGEAAADSGIRPAGCKCWPWVLGYGLCATAALYTHYVSVLILLAQGMFALLWFAGRRRWGSLAGYAACALGVALAFLPWFRFVLGFRATLYSPYLRWIEVPAIPDYYSFLGREYFVGDIWDQGHAWWPPAMILPLLVIGICLRHACAKRASHFQRGAEPSRTGILFLLWLLAGPVILAAAAVVLYHPIYFRARFSLFVLPPFLVLAAIACASFRSRMATWGAAGVLAGVMLAGTYAQWEKPEKLNWRGLAKAWQEKGAPACIVVFPHGFEDALAYYLKKPLVSTRRNEMERLLPALEGMDLWVCPLGGYKFTFYEGEFDYYQWLLTRGTVRNLVVPNSIMVQVVRVEKPSSTEERHLDRWYAPFDILRKIEGFGEKSGFIGYMEYEGAASDAFRWSGPKAWFCLRDSDEASTVILNVQFPPPIPADYRPDLEIYMRRGKTASRLFTGSPAMAIADYRAGPFEIRLAAPAGVEALWIGWTVNPVNIARALRDGKKHDTRDLGLRVNWVGVKFRPG